MFLIRSAFWLTVAFVVMAPHGVDVAGQLGAARTEVMSKGLEAGKTLVVSQILGRVANAAQTTSPSVDPTMQDSSSISPVPFPRPRPDWMG